MSIKSDKSDKTFATVTGTIRVRCDAADANEGAVIALLEEFIDHHGAYHRLGAATAQRDGNIIELKVDVRYGPAFGAYESDIQKLVDALLANGTFKEGEVFNVDRRPLDDAAIEALAASVDDIKKPLAERKRIADALERMKRNKKN